MNDVNNEMVMVVLNPEGLVVMAGKPRKLTAQECRDYLAPGWKVETMEFEKYRALNIKWVGDEEGNHSGEDD